MPVLPFLAGAAVVAHKRSQAATSVNSQSKIVGLKDPSETENNAGINPIGFYPAFPFHWGNPVCDLEKVITRLRHPVNDVNEQSPGVKEILETRLKRPFMNDFASTRDIPDGELWRLPLKEPEGLGNKGYTETEAEKEEGRALMFFLTDSYCDNKAYVRGEEKGHRWDLIEKHAVADSSEASSSAGSTKNFNPIAAAAASNSKDSGSESDSKSEATSKATAVTAANSKAITPWRIDPSWSVEDDGLRGSGYESCFSPPPR